MKQFALVLFLAGCACAQQLDEDFAGGDLSEATMDPRIFFVNFTSSLVQVNATILAYALLALGLAAAAALALYYLYIESQNDSSGYGYGSYGYESNSGYNYQYARSNDEGYDFASSLNIIQWISMLQDLYEKFDYNDLECQKKLICEVMREPDYYGSMAQKFKAGFQYAKYLEVLSLPDEMREILDEYLDANSRAESNKDCEAYFSCPKFSIKDSFKRNISGNHVN